MVAMGISVILMVAAGFAAGSPTEKPPLPPHTYNQEGNPTEKPPLPPVTYFRNEIKDIPLHIRRDIEGFQSLNPTQVNGEDLFEGDVLLSPQQREALTSRKAIIWSLDYRWQDGPDGFPHVPFIFADGNVDQAAVLNGITYWQEHTCIKFDQHSSFGGGPHLQFIKSGGCWSYIGRMYFWDGQQISIGSGCESLGVVAHEIGHAMGFYHEQSRNDRDTYVNINWENIQDEREGNFAKAAANEASNFSIPYDYTSVMHYGSTGFSTNGHNTISTKDPLVQTVIGQRSGLSQRDTHLANIMYGCIDKWIATCDFENDPCLNGGYTGKTCTCICPTGTSGTNCETVTGGYYDEFMGLNERVTAEGIVSTPNHPTTVPYGTRIVKYIVAPECHTIKLSFTSFDLYPESSGRCYWDVLEIRTTNRYDGTFYCGSTSPGVINSPENWIILSMALYGSKTGFSANVEFIRDSSCTPTGTITTSTTTTTTTTTTSSTTTSTTTTTTSSTTTSTTTTTTSSTTTSTTTTTPSTVCTEQTIEDKLYWSSPDFGISDYPNNAMCDLMVSNEEPRWTKVTLESFALQGKVNTKCVDFVDFVFPYSKIKKFCGSASGKKVKIPNANVQSIFESNPSITKTGFNVYYEHKTSPCHQKIVLTSLGESGSFSPPNYPNADTKKKRMCETWIIAPAGLRVQLEFENLSLNSKCKISYVVVNPEGDRTYPKSTSTRHCGNTLPAPMISSGNEIDLVYYSKPKVVGFKVNYTVVN